MSIQREEGTAGPPPGRKAGLFTLTAGECTLRLSSLGAAWLSLLVPSRRTGTADVLLGYANLDDYAENPVFFGATIGRFANRIGGARFRLNGRDYALGRNDGNHCLHGGPGGFHTRVWQAEAWEEDGAALVRFSLESPGGDGGFPGALRAEVTYALDGTGEIRAQYRAELDAPCPVSLTNHAYFNLAGKGDVLSHQVMIPASRRLERDGECIPTGRFLSVEGTPWDFRVPKLLGRDLEAAGGYDDCYVPEGEPGTLRTCAEIFEETSGRSLRVLSTQRGLQFYSGNSLEGVPGKGGVRYGKYGGLCLETQAFPDSPNHPEFADAPCGPGRPYYEEARFIFGW